jgi:hypothetical protein
MHAPKRSLMLALALCACGAAADTGLPGGAWLPVPAATLEQYRGGFTNGSGLEFSLGLERLVSINGELVAHTTLQIDDVRAMTATQAQAARDHLATGVIQNGANNQYFGSLDNTSAGMLVQNTLNDQTIRTQTVINSTLNSLSLLKDLNFQSTLRDAAIGAIGQK